MDFYVPEHELVLGVMDFNALDSGLVLLAWILVLWSMNWGSLECLWGSFGRLLGFARYSGAPGGSQEDPEDPGGPRQPKKDLKEEPD